MLEVDKNTMWTDVRRHVMQKSILADLHQKNHGSACGMFAMYLEQLSSYGCLSGEGSERESTRWRDSRCGRHGFRRDEDKMKHHAKEASTPTFFVLFFALPCLLHLCHCIVKRSLAFADKLCETVSFEMHARLKYVIGTKLYTPN